MTTTVASVTKYFPSAQDGFTTTLASTVSSGATSVQLNSVAGYSNGQVVVLIVDPSSATAKQCFTGTVDTSGVQITGVVWTSGSNQAHSLGATVVDYETATHWSMVAKGLLVAHEQTGVHKSGAAYPAPTISDYSNATHDHSTAGGGGLLYSSAWTSYTPTFTSLSVGNGTLTGAYKQIGTVVIGKFKLIFGSSTTVSGAATFTLPVTALATSYSALGSTQIGAGSILDSSGPTVYPAMACYSTTTVALIRVSVTNSTYASHSGIGTSIPFVAAWTTNDEISLQFMYEAA